MSHSVPGTKKIVVVRGCVASRSGIGLGGVSRLRVHWAADANDMVLLRNSTRLSPSGKVCIYSRRLCDIVENLRCSSKLEFHCAVDVALM